MPLPPDIPAPLVYGPSFPKFKVYMRDGRQRFESHTNRNLFLTADDFDHRDTYTMSSLLKTLEPCRNCGCRKTSFETHQCPLVFGEIDFDDKLSPRSFKMWRPPDFNACPGFDILISFCRSDAQKDFLWKYCTSLAAQAPAFVDMPDLPAVYRNILTPIHKSLRREEQHTGEFARAVERFLLDAECSFPALIPEVWFNVVGYDKTPDDERHLRENPQCVDFVLFSEGRKCVIEVDGPSHYATYTEGGGWSVSQELYTKNLRIERSLRRQGWEIHRFSNLEVEETQWRDFPALIQDLPGIQPRGMTSGEVRQYVEEFAVGLDTDDIPF